MLPHVGAMLAHLGGYVAILRPRLAQDILLTRGGARWGGVGRRQGARPLSPTERRETPSAMPRPGGPWPDLSAYARQPARGPTMLAYLEGNVGPCWPILKAMWVDLEAYVDPC